MKDPTEDNNDASLSLLRISSGNGGDTNGTYLDDEEGDGIRGIPSAWICALKDAALGGYLGGSGGGRRSLGRDGGSHHTGNDARHDESERNGRFGEDE